MFLSYVLQLRELNSNKKLFLFDTYQGMTEPSLYDKSYKKLNVLKKFNKQLIMNESMHLFQM